MIISNKNNMWIKNIFIAVFSIFAVIWSVFPIFWMVKSSLTPNIEMYQLNPSLLPSRLIPDHYIELFTETTFMTYFFNSIYVAFFSTLVALILSILGSYAMTRLRFSSRKFMQKSILLAYLLPAAVLFIPMYVLISRLGLGNNKNSLIIVYQTIIIPYCCYMLMSYFTAIPKSMEEAAFIDGCGYLQALIKVILPIAAPSIAVVAVFAFTLSWNEYLYALVLTTSPSQQTVTIGISGFRYSDTFIWGLIMSASTISSLPVVMLYIAAQQFMKTGLTAGGVKQ
ncbi:MAG: carbohydrate ABC transporter permease [Spirochaetales bacterium]